MWLCQCGATTAESFSPKPAVNELVAFVLNAEPGLYIVL